MLVVISNSGVNAASLEAASGKERGATVVAITSESYSRQAAKGGPRLADIADIVLDNGAPSGDGRCQTGGLVRAASSAFSARRISSTLIMEPSGNWRSDGTLATALASEATRFSSVVRRMPEKRKRRMADRLPDCVWRSEISGHLRSPQSVPPGD